jgi:hypothetical protein
MGFKGRCDGGGAPGSKGRAGLIVGMGEVRRCWRTTAICWGALLALYLDILHGEHDVHAEQHSSCRVA